MVNSEEWLGRDSLDNFREIDQRYDVNYNYNDNWIVIVYVITRL